MTIRTTCQDVINYTNIYNFFMVNLLLGAARSLRELFNELIKYWLGKRARMAERFANYADYAMVKCNFRPLSAEVCSSAFHNLFVNFLALINFSRWLHTQP